MAHNKESRTGTGIRVIRTRADYEQMHAELERLLDLDPPRGSPDRDRLDVLLVLLADYETREVPAPQVDPIDAILFRLDQLGMQPRDLEPYLGGRSRVSEVLARKRPLSIAMIRALNEGLGVPAEALINPASPREENPDASEVPWERFPIREMISRGWIRATQRGAWSREAAQRILEPLFGPSGSGLAAEPLYRRTAHVRAGKEMDEFALAAWTARVLQLASEGPKPRRFDPHTLQAEQLRSLAQLSRLAEGPRLTREWLADRGIVMVVEAHLPRTRLDGAAILTEEGVPVIALTIRYDRLDNFWFTLFHEIGHVLRHLGSGSDIRQYFDDLDVTELLDPQEQEADAFAQESLVPAASWQASAVAFAPSVDAAEALADELGISPAVVAGRVRHQKRNFRLLHPLIGTGMVRHLFPEVSFG
jgi:HTH-type transcriptional regulator/antitoxin HigA